MTKVYELVELKVEVTNSCLLACIHCSSDAEPSSPHVMAPEDCLRIIKEALTLGVKEIVFSGGEPLLWKSLRTAIRLASGGGMQVTVYSSGNVPTFEAKILELRNAGLYRIVFSIFGATEETHDEITRKKGSYLNTSKAIEEAVKCGLRVEAHFVPISTNYKELEGIAKQTSNLGISHISVLRFVPQGRGSLIVNRSLNKFQNISLKKSITQLRTQGYQIRTGSPYNFLMLNEQPECAAGINRLIIGPDLRIYPCDAFKKVQAEEVVGTVKYSSLADHTLVECWNKSPFLNTVREYLNTPFDDPCKSCIVLADCCSGCLAQKVIMSGDFRKRPDPMCLLIH